MNFVLPPKRWQSTESTIYDPVRCKGWFAKLETRRTIIPIMRGAAGDFLTNKRSQQEVCLSWNVDARELRDYLAFHHFNSHHSYTANDQAILDHAYRLYNARYAMASIRVCLKDAAKQFGVSFRPVTELWETHPSFYPKDYPAGYKLSSK